MNTLKALRRFASSFPLPREVISAIFLNAFDQDPRIIRLSSHVGLQADFIARKSVRVAIENGCSGSSSNASATTTTAAGSGSGSGSSSNTHITAAAAAATAGGSLFNNSTLMNWIKERSLSKDYVEDISLLFTLPLQELKPAAIAKRHVVIGAKRRFGYHHR